MALCDSKASFAEVDYAESSDRARPIMELGARPKGFPEYWHYKLKDVVVADCPVAKGAQQQAFVLAFKDIAWLNYDAEKPLGNKIEPTAADIPKVYPTDPSAKKGVKWYVITWIAPAADTGDKECPVLNTKPTEADVIRYYSAEDAAALKKQNGEKGISYGQQTEARGPGKLNAVLMPGIVPDPGLIEPKSDIAEGIDLDGDDGAGTPPKGIRKHKNYTSPDGRTGIDNQFYAISGCVAGFRGKTGYRNQTSNARRADGNITTLIEV
ncbi:hypothetical protein ADT71_01680 [Novosphingobium sp. ST904]|nr:hypothetical protein ADT71_01680 [Novosphingobium sp. ST904]